MEVKNMEESMDCGKASEMVWREGFTSCSPFSDISLPVVNKPTFLIEKVWVGFSSL